jgi:DNA modification methylase
MNSTRRELTFKHNLSRGRHGWLRLTPAYSVRVVHDILDAHPSLQTILDPFSGSGTTGLVAAERGLHCDLTDINPFLVWLGRVKTANYSTETLEEMWASARRLSSLNMSVDVWLPPLHNIERWWDAKALAFLGSLYQQIEKDRLSDTARNLLHIAFCRLLIELSNAAFNHQSMSFRETSPVTQTTLWEDETVHEQWSARFLALCKEIRQSAMDALVGSVNVTLEDARLLTALPLSHYDAVITSPPYPNRMSYIRELRPYMYWLGYLREARTAGELDWQAIGGTWGIATSRLLDWSPNTDLHLDGFAAMIARINDSSPQLANYVHKYFVDMFEHLCKVRPKLKSGGRVFYIVGNSKFYDVLVPVEQLYVQMMERAGFLNIDVTLLRKRNSKKELYEYMVSAQTLD